MAVYDNFMRVYVVVIKLLVFLVTNVTSGCITRVDELEVILQDVFGGELLHTEAAMLSLPVLTLAAGEDEKMSLYDHVGDHVSSEGVCRAEAFPQIVQWYGLMSMWVIK